MRAMIKIMAARYQLENHVTRYPVIYIDQWCRPLYLRVMTVQSGDSKVTLIVIRSRSACPLNGHSLIGDYPRQIIISDSVKLLNIYLAESSMLLAETSMFFLAKTDPG